MKSMQGVTDWVITVGTDAVNAVSRMEGAFKCTAYTFKVLENIKVPEDYYNLTTAMMNPQEIPTLDKFRATVTKILNNRYWTWHLTHPNIGDRVHPTRSMLPILITIASRICVCFHPALCV